MIMLTLHVFRFICMIRPIVSPVSQFSF